MAKQRQEKDAEVWFISNSDKNVAVAMQKGSDDSPIIVWDYHVVYFSPAFGVFDFDSLCNFPSKPAYYLKSSFADCRPYLSEEFSPYFRVLPAVEYCQQFASDRTHMLDDQGGYLHEPPQWDTIGSANNFPSYIDFENKETGNIFSLEEMLERFSAE